MAVMTEAWLHDADGAALFYREWLVENACGAVQIVHGLGEHSGRYGELAALFNAMGLSVRAQDHRGHGRSDGARGSIDKGEDFLLDLKQSFAHFSHATNSVPFLFGHSMGGLIAARFATGGFGPVRGLMLSSPALAIRLSRFQRVLLALGSALAPGLAISSGLPPEGITHDPEVLRSSREDTLNHSSVSSRVVRFMLDAIARCQADAPQLTIPVLLQVAGNDSLVDASGSKRFFAQLPEGRKTLHWYAEAYHEIFNESQPLRQRVQQDLIAWMEVEIGREQRVMLTCVA
ncbi:alpha/beta hydrolase [Herbaspirillum sp. RTI4]|uniref:alpha/beta hydrolase n=1 Tax=Herbaspirillum sp. RTI4 TaxID=3048640 RepID=UPI002AB4E2E4|nr:alpha/beta hydrolase [Herbaspirillum sp. RTI4]MDY7579389.1 alpha/beta hydrolase [Herbaspirillum sp. RTI4]MEA9980303.1 alpha/beta hydrolase [Herbaspirillum sp. RTI4]